jgi:hypothetical protein
MTPIDFVVFGGDSDPNAPVFALAEALREDLVVIGPDGPMEVLSYYMQNGRMVLEICHKGDE